MTARTGPQAARAVAVVLALAVATLAACGIPTQKHPQPLAEGADGIGVSTTSPTTLQVPTGNKVALYFVDQDTQLLARSERAVKEKDVTAATAIRELLAGTTKDEQEQKLVSAIPPDTKLLSSAVTDGVLLLNLSEQLSTISGVKALQAYAQMVFTATDIDGIDEVRFAIDEERVDVPSDDGNIPQVSRKNYRSLSA